MLNLSALKTQAVVWSNAENAVLIQAIFIKVVDAPNAHTDSLKIDKKGSIYVPSNADVLD